MKKLISIMLVIAMITVGFAGCSGSGGSSDNVELYVFVSMPEYADAMDELITEYKTVNPNVTINYETTQSDYPTLLKAKLNSGEVPDIFASASGKEIDMYKEYSLSLDGQPLVEAMLPAVAETMKSSEGEIHGLALKSNFFGTVYNKDIFEEAGVDKFPETLDELEAACEKIEAAGYQPFTSGLAEWWVFKHAAMNFISASDPNAKELVSKFEKGEAKISDYPIIYDNYFRYVDLLVKYGDEKPLESDLSTEISGFASGKAAMTNGQGAWVEADMLKINPKINIGFNGYAVSDDLAQCQVISGSDQALRVSNSSKHQEELLEFVNWWYTSDYGVKWFTDVANVVPPIKTDVESKFEIIKQGSELVEEKGSGQLTVIYSTDSFHTAFGETMQSYVAGTMTKDEVCAQIESKWQELDGGSQ